MKPVFGEKGRKPREEKSQRRESGRKWLDKFWNQIWALGSQNWDFGVKNGFFPESCTMTASPVSCSCIFFTRLHFELSFGVNMKVVDNCVSFPVASV
ncbi:hypothetical protein MTR_3g079690 [Medicago truncatula]|uniref:Uncharacterized protein n=1 Tax=Medicago truncatula TaxID=3880 RepID=G7J6L5_MEDTR|nr:hypothetical protein MTR_3g079690 [Medicago truncatula]